MPDTIRAARSAGSWFPEPVTITVAGFRLSALEMRVRDVGALERDFAMLAGHPRTRVATDYRAMQTLPPGDSERGRAIRRVLIEDKKWPPRLGSDWFSEILCTVRGSNLYLWRCLRRTCPTLTPRRSASLCRRMDRDDWAVLDRVAWGRQAWELVHHGEVTPAERARQADNAGVAWGKAVPRLAKDFGWTPEQVGDLFISQFLALLSGEPDREAWIADYPDDPAEG